MKYNVTVSKSTGTVTQTETATVEVSADSDAGARRIATQLMQDDSGDIAWTTAPTVAVASTNALAHIVTVAPVPAPTAAAAAKS